MILPMYLGPHDLLVNTGVCFVPGTTAGQMHEAIHRIEADLHSACPQTCRIPIEGGSLPAGAKATLPPGP